MVDFNLTDNPYLLAVALIPMVGYAVYRWFNRPNPEEGTGEDPKGPGTNEGPQGPREGPDVISEEPRPQGPEESPGPSEGPIGPEEGPGVISDVLPEGITPMDVIFALLQRAVDSVEVIYSSIYNLIHEIPTIRDTDELINAFARLFSLIESFPLTIIDYTNRIRNITPPGDMIIDVVYTITGVAVPRIEQLIALLDHVDFIDGIPYFYGMNLLANPLAFRAGVSTMVLGVLSHYSLQMRFLINRGDVFYLIHALSYTVVEHIFNTSTREQMIGRMNSLAQTLSGPNPIWGPITRSVRLHYRGNPIWGPIIRSVRLAWEQV